MLWGVEELVHFGSKMAAILIIAANVNMRHRCWYGGEWVGNGLGGGGLGGVGGGGGGAVVIDVGIDVVVIVVLIDTIPSSPDPIPTTRKDSIEDGRGTKQQPK